MPTTLRDVVEGGLCTGCGLCESLAGRDRVEMQVSPAGQLRPALHTVLSPAEERSLVDACPGVTAIGPDPETLDPGTRLDPVWGPLRGVTRGWASDRAVRHRAAAGGALTALSCFLLDDRRVDAIVHVRASTSDPMLTDAMISRTPDEVMSGAQSRYGPAAPLVHVRQLLDDGARFAVVAKPCDVAAIRNLQRQDPRARQQVPYLLTLFCGGVPHLGTAHRIAEHHGVDSSEVALFRWRGEGWPGSTHVKTRDGRSFDLTYDETWFDVHQPWRYDVQWRCKICPDAIGELADVVCPDGWLLDASRRPLHEEAPGVNVVLERTPVGSELVAAATAAGYLEAAPLPHEEFEAMHPDHRQRRLGEPARLTALQVAGVAQPRVEGYRLTAVADLADPDLLSSQLNGTVRRIRAGQAREVPVSE